MYLREQFDIPLEGFKSEKEVMKWAERDKNTILHNAKDDLSKKKEFGNKSNKRKAFEKSALVNKSKWEIYKPIYDAIDKYPHLQLEFTYLKLIVFGDKAPFVNRDDYLGDNHIYSVQSSHNSIAEAGIYIKYLPFLSDKELLALKKEASKSYAILMENKKLAVRELLADVKEKRKRKSLSDEVERYYLKIEERCIDRYIKNKFIQLGLFFQELADELKVNSSIIRNSYYTIQKRYNLPSVTEASDIPVL